MKEYTTAALNDSTRIGQRNSYRSTQLVSVNATRIGQRNSYRSTQLVSVNATRIVVHFIFLTREYTTAVVDATQIE
jgi:uncharacterized membrane protein